MKKIFLALLVILNSFSMVRAEKIDWPTVLKFGGFGMMVLGVCKILQSEKQNPITVTNTGNSGQGGHVNFFSLGFKSNTMKGSILLGFGLFTFLKGYNLSCHNISSN